MECESISQFSNAIKVKISYCYISSIPPLTKTVQLHLHDCDITAFDSSDFPVLRDLKLIECPNLKTIVLTGSVLNKVILKLKSRN
jgi:hypothetical protein